MAAATVDFSFSDQHLGMPRYVKQLSALTSGQLESLSYSAFMPKSKVHEVRVEVTEAPDSGDQLTWVHELDQDVQSSSTAALRFFVRAGGDITGAKVRVFLTFKDGAPQDQTSTTTVNS